MQPNKRSSPTIKHLSTHQEINSQFQQDDIQVYNQPKKKVKKDSNSSNIIMNNSGSLDLIESFKNQMDIQSLKNSDNADAKGLYELQIQNLRASSFRTFSKLQVSKFNSMNKFDNFDLQSSSAKKGLKRISPPKVNSSSKSKKINNKNKVQIQKQRFSSMKQLLKLEKHLSEHQESNYKRQPIQKVKRKQSLNPLNEHCNNNISYNTINTQFLNQLGEMNVFDQNQINSNQLEEMIKTALIKNVVFKCDIVIKSSQDNQEISSKKFVNVQVQKLLHVNGFNITGFYLKNEKIRINLQQTITNLKFQKMIKQSKDKTKSDSQNSQRLENSAEQINKTHEISFSGKTWQPQNNQWIDCSIGISIRTSK